MRFTRVSDSFFSPTQAENQAHFPIYGNLPFESFKFLFREMTQTNYQRGRAAEYQVKQLLKNMGYRFIIRSAASHTPIDLLAARGRVPNRQVIAIQVKGGRKGRISRHESEKLLEWARAFKATPVLAKKSKKR